MFVVGDEIFVDALMARVPDSADLGSENPRGSETTKPFRRLATSITSETALAAFTVAGDVWKHIDSRKSLRRRRLCKLIEH